MADNTGIEWTDATWNCIVGCSVISPGCKKCYAMKMAARLESMGVDSYRGLTTRTKGGPVWTGEVRLARQEIIEMPLRWRKPKRVFVNSMADCFHESLPDSAIDQVFGIMALSPQHQFQVLTKRDERMLAYCSDPATPRRVWDAARAVADPLWALRQQGVYWGDEAPWPLRNVWLGVSVEDRERTSRIESLRRAPAAVRFLSCEPLLEDLGALNLSDIYWVIVGGESGHGARPMRPDWVRSLRKQTAEAGAQFFLKQIGSNKENWPSGIVGKGGDPAQWPLDLRVREFPQAAA